MAYKGKKDKRNVVDDRKETTFKTNTTLVTHILDNPLIS